MRPWAYTDGCAQLAINSVFLHQSPRLLRSKPDGGRSGERSLHTGEVVGSIPTAPTILSKSYFTDTFNISFLPMA